MYVQNCIKLSAAVRELSTEH